MHDIVRDYTRDRLIGSADDIRSQQRGIIKAIIAATPDTDWRDATPIGRYVRQSLRQHMVEAMATVADGGAASPERDTVMQSWLDASDRVMHSFVVRTAADAIGGSVLESMAKKYEERGDLVRAAKRLVSAAYTMGMAVGMGSTGDEDTDEYNKKILEHASNLLAQAEADGVVQSATLRSQHAIMVGKLVIDYVRALSSAAYDLGRYANTAPPSRTLCRS